ncbi:GyrI-like domain-containing protein [Kribbella sp. NPDC051137]|uniref:GyrI-like domain-containing protein n=1 Tax=Kribbella sp. NPDC051137 TaxID=3155045 RepID=UPI002F785F72
MNTYEVVEELRKEQPTAVVSATLAVPDIGAWLGKAYGTVASTILAQGAAPAGAPFARYHPLGDGRFDVQAGFPVTAALTPTNDVQAATLPAGPAAATVHIGPYDTMEPAYGALTQWITTHNASPIGDPWEIYYSDPGTHPDPNTWRTEIVQPYIPNPHN